jgi:hypothetical protein
MSPISESNREDIQEINVTNLQVLIIQVKRTCSKLGIDSTNGYRNIAHRAII